MKIKTCWQSNQSIYVASLNSYYPPESVINSAYRKVLDFKENAEKILEKEKSETLCLNDFSKAILDCKYMPQTYNFIRFDWEFLFYFNSYFTSTYSLWSAFIWNFIAAQLHKTQMLHHFRKRQRRQKETQRTTAATSTITTRYTYSIERLWVLFAYGLTASNEQKFAKQLNKWFVVRRCQWWRQKSQCWSDHEIEPVPSW